MASSITIELPDEVRSELDAATRVEAVSASEIVVRALKNYLFTRRFRMLREETLAQLHEAGQGDLSDVDVLGRLS